MEGAEEREPQTVIDRPTDRLVPKAIIDGVKSMVILYIHEFAACGTCQITASSYIYVIGKRSSLLLSKALYNTAAAVSRSISLFLMWLLAHHTINRSLSIEVAIIMQKHKNFHIHGTSAGRAVPYYNHKQCVAARAYIPYKRIF